MLLLAFGVFGLGTVFCGFARTMNELLLARAVAGIGGGGMTTLVAIILSAVIPLNQRGMWQGYNNIVYAAGLGVGAPLGGYFADTVGWRWCVEKASTSIFSPPGPRLNILFM